MVPFGVDFAIMIFANRLNAEFRPQPVRFWSVPPDRKRASQRLIVATPVLTSLTT